MLVVFARANNSSNAKGCAMPFQPGSPRGKHEPWHAPSRTQANPNTATSAAAQPSIAAGTRTPSTVQPYQPVRASCQVRTSPVYRPAVTNVQPKMAARPILPTVQAPPVYRPNVAGIQPRMMAMPGKSAVQPPAVYRPASVGLQRKPAAAGALPQGAPPVYCPQGVAAMRPPVVQRVAVQAARHPAATRLPAAPPAMRFAAVQRVAVSRPAAWNRGAIQRRGSNPYASGGGDISHHIIPHSTLVKNLNNLGAIEKQNVLRRFLPNFDDLTIATLTSAGIVDAANQALVISYNGATVTLYLLKHNADLADLAVKRFGDLTNNEKATLQFDGATFQQFQQSYAVEKNGGAVGVGVIHLGAKGQVMKEAFFEWQSGNQFYGPDRYEPGTSNEFDGDARFVYGEEHVKRLKAISARLKATENAFNQADVVAAFNALADAETVNREIPRPHLQWVALNSNLRQELLTAMEKYDRVVASGAVGARKDYKKIPKALVLELIERTSSAKLDIGKKAWHVLYNYVVHGLGSNGKSIPEVDHPAFPNWTVKPFEKTKLKFINYEGKVVESGESQSAIYAALDQLFKARAKEVFGL
jgi:hypothetical protein